MAATTGSGPPGPRAPRGGAPPWRVDEGVERPDQAALFVDQLAAAGADDAVPHLAAVVVEIVIAQIRKSGHAGTVFLGARSGAPDDAAAPLRSRARSAGV